jgi:hypothetical protein
MMKNKDYYKDFVSDEMGYVSKKDPVGYYLNNMYMLGTYADNYVIAAAVEVYPIDLIFLGSQAQLFDYKIQSRKGKAEQVGLIGHVGTAHHFVLFVDKPTPSSPKPTEPAVGSTSIKPRSVSDRVHATRKLNTEKNVDYEKLLDEMGVPIYLYEDSTDIAVTLAKSKSYSKHVEPIIQVHT